MIEVDPDGVMATLAATLNVAARKDGKSSEAASVLPNLGAALEGEEENMRELPGNSNGQITVKPLPKNPI